MTTESVENAVYDASLTYFNPNTISGDENISKIDKVTYILKDYISSESKTGYIYLDESCYIPNAI